MPAEKENPQSGIRLPYAVPNFLSSPNSYDWGFFVLETN